MRRTLFPILLLLAAFVAIAGNYPYHSSYLWVTIPDHADWTYKMGEQAEVEVQFYKYGIPCDGVVEYSVGDDLMPDDTHGKAQLKGGRCTIRIGTAHKPCFRDLRLKIRLDEITYQHHVKVGFSPEQIRPFTRQPSDFRPYWEEALKEAAEYPLKYTKELQPEFSNEKTDCYLVKLELNRRHRSFYGYLMMPKNAKPGTCPVVLSPPGQASNALRTLIRETISPNMVSSASSPRFMGWTRVCRKAISKTYGPLLMGR